MAALAVILVVMVVAGMIAIKVRNHRTYRELKTYRRINRKYSKQRLQEYERDMDRWYGKK
jgi:uncharacterized membrane-anchored protein YhcB (DUF1043 family)